MVRQVKAVATLVAVIALTLMCVMTSPVFAANYNWDNGGGAGNGMNNPVNYQGDLMPYDPPEPVEPINGTPMVDGTPQCKNRIYINLSLDGTTIFGGLVDSSMAIDFGNEWDNRYYSGGALSYSTDNRLYLDGGTTADSLTMTGGSLQVNRVYMGTTSKGGMATLNDGSLEVWDRTVLGDYSSAPGVQAILNIGGGNHSMQSMSLGMWSTGILNMTGGTLGMLIRETPDFSDGPDGVGEFELPYIRLAEKASATGILNLDGGEIYIEQAWIADAYGDLPALQMLGDYYGYTSGGAGMPVAGTGSINITAGKMVFGAGGGSGDIEAQLLSHVDTGQITAYGLAKGDAGYGTLYTAIVEYYSTDDQTVMQAGMVGDLNLDGIVNPIDLATLNANMGLTGAMWADGDVNFDDVVDSVDAALLMNNYVPEPSCLLMLAFLVAAAARVVNFSRRK